MARRGFFAEMQHQQQVAARQHVQAMKAAQREQVAAARHAEQARKQAEQAYGQAVRAAAADRKRAEQEAKRLHLEAMAAEVESMNIQLAREYEEIDGLLAATLAVDDFVDLESLRTVAEHPPFSRADLEMPVPPPPPDPGPPEPQWVEPPAPKGFGSLLGGKKRYADVRAQAWASYSAEHAAWQAATAQLPTQQLDQMQRHQEAETRRVAELAAARRAYDDECAERQALADESNKRLDELIAGLAAGEQAAVEEYIGVVLGNSVYPKSFPVEHDFDFDAELKELALRVTVPGPEQVNSVKAYKCNRSTDEIASTSLTQKEQKERYASAVEQTAVRSIHEVFEADRRATIRTISLAVGTDSIDPATGQVKRTPLVAVAVDRDTFETFDLAHVVPGATLEHLGALVSKNPFGLVAIDTSKGIRGK